MLSLVLLLLVLGLASAQDLQCHVQGECVAFFTDISTEDNYDRCLQTCKAEEDCHWFTFNGNNDDCIRYNTCPSIDSTCVSCHTGQKECLPETAVCEAPGFCNGPVIATDTAQTARDCLILCNQFDNCNWYTYFTASQECFLMEDCSFFDGSCADCISGERRCYQVFDKLFLVGGHGAYFMAEIVDLSPDNKTCPSIPNYSPAGLGSAGTFMDNQVLVCGGLDYTSDCFYYDPGTNSWVQTQSMSELRAYPGAVQMSPTEWWLSGGLASEGDELESSEIYLTGQGSSPYVDLPDYNSLHSIVKIDSTHFMMIGDTYSSGKRAWIFDRDLEEWSPVQDLQFGRAGSMAGLVRFPNGTQVVLVTGGAFAPKSTEFFDLVGERWISGPDLPVEMMAGNLVQYGDSVLVMGGYDSEALGYLDSIYEFNLVAEDWVELSQKMGTSRAYFAAFLVPSDFVTCS